MSHQFCTLHIKDYSSLYRRQVDFLSVSQAGTVVGTEKARPRHFNTDYRGDRNHEPHDITVYSSQSHSIADTEPIFLFKHILSASNHYDSYSVYSFVLFVVPQRYLTAFRNHDNQSFITGSGPKSNTGYFPHIVPNTRG